MSADSLLPAVLIGALAVICLANGIRVLLMHPWEWEQEQRRFGVNPSFRAPRLSFSNADTSEASQVPGSTK